MGRSRTRYPSSRLAELTLARQFPRIAAAGPAGVTEIVRRVGPIQTQVARSAFGAVWSRLPGATCADIEAAYENGDVVRGSNLRGTVHTCARDHHAVLDAVARRATAGQWQRALKLQRATVDAVRAEMERYATGAWRAPAELRAHLKDWLAAHDSTAAARAAATPGAGQAMAHLHSGLIRRPLRGAWHAQGAPGYRLAEEVLGEQRDEVVADPQAALAELVRIHVNAFGPSTRRDIAWWSGAGLGEVDRALAGLKDELVDRSGPDGETCYDTVAPPRSVGDPGLRLLPEFDAVLLAYAPPGRDRFVDPAHLPRLWTTANGMYAALVLADGRIRGAWALRSAGKRRTVEVRMFPGERRLDEGDLGPQVTALAAALDLEVDDVQVLVGAFDAAG